MTRPPLTRCTVSSACARIAGGRSDARATSGPSCTRRVSAATAPSNAKHSRAPRRGGGMSRHRWSYTNTPSRPAASARRATASGVSGSSTNDGRVMPSFIVRHDRSAASSAAPTAPARDPSAAGRIGISGRCSVPSSRAAERDPQRVEEQRAHVDHATRDDDALQVEDVGEVRETERDVVGVVLEESLCARRRPSGPPPRPPRRSRRPHRRPQQRGSPLPFPRRRARGPSGRARCPLAIDSQCPSSPQAQTGPSRSTVTWPISPANPFGPR